MYNGTMEDSAAVNRLINSWDSSVIVNGKEVVRVFPPLVDLLRENLPPGMESSAGNVSDPSTRSPIDLTALDLMTKIGATLKAWLEEWGVRRSGELKLDIRAYWDALTMLNRRGQIDDVVYDHLASMPDRWEAQIWDAIDPPKRVPLRNAACPRCGLEKIEDRTGTFHNALTVTLRTGHAEVAECGSRDCEAIWIGKEGLLTLASELGITRPEGTLGYPT